MSKHLTSIKLIRSSAIALGLVLLSGIVLSGAMSSSNSKILVCDLSDTKAILDVDFEAIFCTKVASGIGYNVAKSASSDVIAKQLISISVTAIGPAQAQYVVQISANGVHTKRYGPLLVEIMDADLTQALATHVINDLKRFNLSN